MAQLSLLPQAKTPKDIVFTNAEVALDIIYHFKPSGSLLDPCRGQGSFYDNFPSNTRRAYCEISEGKDFYNWSESVDWVIGNPPYSIFHEFLTHSFQISDNVLFLVPTNKVFQSWRTMSLINKWGGIKGILVYGSGHLVGFPFGFSVGAFHFEKGYKSEVITMRKPPENWRTSR
jgi:hypothetical protein